MIHREVVVVVVEQSCRRLVAEQQRVRRGGAVLSLLQVRQIALRVRLNAVLARRSSHAARVRRLDLETVGDVDELGRALARRVVVRRVAGELGIAPISVISWWILVVIGADANSARAQQPNAQHMVVHLWS